MTKPQALKRWLMQHKWFVLLAAAELIFLFLHFFLAMQVQDPITLTGSDLVAEHSKAFLDENGGLAIQNTKDYNTYASTPVITLKKGSYTVTLDYQSTLEGGKMTQENFLVQCNDVSLDPEERTVTFLLWARADTGTSFEFSYNGGFRSIYGLTVTPTRAYSRTSTICWFLVLALADLALLLWRGALRVPQALVEQRRYVFALTLLYLFVCMPLLTGYVIGGDDLCFHSSRILGLADGLRAGQFPVKLQPSLLNGNGYANGVFYPDFFLYPIAILLIIGFRLPDLYLFYTAMVNLATLLICWFCFKKIFQDRQIALIGTAAYLFATYRITDLYTRQSLGEFTALTFLPLIFYSLWAIFTQAPDSPGYRRLWVPGAVGYAGLILSHILTCQIAAVFTVLTCLVCIRRVFRKETFFNLAKIVLAATAACLWFVVPLLDYLFTDQFRINTDAAWDVFLPISNNTFLPQLLELFYDPNHTSYNIAHGMPGDMALGVGAGLVFGALLLLWCLLEHTEKGSPVRRLGVFSLCMGALAAFMTTTLFPWYELSLITSAVTVFLTRMQFPWRILCAAILFLAVATAAAFALAKKQSRALFQNCALVFSGLMLVGTSFFFHQILMNGGPAYYYDLSDLNGALAQVSLGEYIFPNVLPNTVWEHDYVDYDSDVVSVDSYVKGDLTATFHAVNPSEQEQTVTVPLLCYKGYQAQDATGAALTVTRNKNGQVTVTLPPQYSETITVAFVEPWYWRAAEGFSLAFVLALAAWGAWTHHKGKGQRTLPAAD